MDQGNAIATIARLQAPSSAPSGHGLQAAIEYFINARDLPPRVWLPPGAQRSWKRGVWAVKRERLPS